MILGIICIVSVIIGLLLIDWDETCYSTLLSALSVIGIIGGGIGTIIFILVNLEKIIKIFEI